MPMAGWLYPLPKRIRAVLRALGAPVDSPGGLSRLIQERRIELWRRFWNQWFAVWAGTAHAGKTCVGHAKYRSKRCSAA
jgi:hypothetical protein